MQPVAVNDVGHARVLEIPDSKLPNL